MNINCETQYFGVLGYPVKHSKSPLLFNQLFKHFRYNGVFRFIEQENTKKAIEAIRTLNFKGVSVTLPHKNLAVKHLDWLDPTAKELNCVNTICNDDGILKGYNYDGYGAIEGLEKIEPNWFEKKILIIGNGGAAMGIAMSMVLFKKINKLHFLIRNPKKFANLKKNLENKGVDVLTFDLKDENGLKEIEKLEIIINTTPVGMRPHLDESPLPVKLISGDMTVYDIVYNPEETKLLQEARQQGAKIVYGKEMFIGQAALQFKCWTGIDVDKILMKKILTKNINKKL